MKKLLAILFAMLLMMTVAACDTPREQAVEEKVEDTKEAQGMSEDAAEQQGEAAKDSAGTVMTDTTGTTATTATVTDTSVTTATTGT